MAAEPTKVPEELSKGARWMIDRIDAMQADYKVCSPVEAACGLAEI